MLSLMLALVRLALVISANEREGVRFTWRAVRYRPCGLRRWR